MKGKVNIAFSIALIATLLINIICLFKPLWRPFERRVYDLKYKLNVQHDRNENIVIIDIDERSLEKLGRYQYWPRMWFARVVNYLQDAGAVGIDVFFGEPDTLPTELREYYENKPVSFDPLLENAIKKNGNIILVSSVEKEPIFTGYNRIGIGEIIADDDGIVRTGFYKLFGKKTFAGEIAEMVKGKCCRKKFLIYFLSDDSFRKISFYDVLRERVPKEYFQDKIVIIGGTAAGLFDYHAIPFQRHFPGVSIQANLVNNFINDLKVHEVRYSYVILLTFVLSIIVAWLILNKSVKIYLTFNIAIYSFFIVAAFVLFNLKEELGVIRPSYVLLLTALISLIYRYQFEEREKRKIKTIFSRYYSKELVERLIENPPKLGGEKVDCTIIFADIRDFTPYAEKTEPENVEQRLNSFLDAMVQTVFKYQGRVDKFIGDCVMAVFGSPVMLKNHALNACRAALEMVDEAERLGLKIGIGINSGEVISGNFGSTMRMEYTVIGDAVNLASRLESITKEFNRSVICSKTTYQHVKDEKESGLNFTELGKAKVKGKKEEVSVYSVDYQLSNFLHT